jgi:hypothetical protein
MGHCLLDYDYSILSRGQVSLSIYRKTFVVGIGVMVWSRVIFASKPIEIAVSIPRASMFLLSPHVGTLHWDL